LFVLAVKLPLLQRVVYGEVMESWEHPAEQAQAGLLAPAVRVALAGVDAGSLRRPADQCEDHVADRQSENQPLDPINVAPAKGMACVR
jgi:hypothetical protein